ncbi:MAG: D,D-dipeptide ABC transporter permease, partial [Tateyamaria sp.]|nr:D,D-dipeptide ABC transporter permease [Tateyamaria sp.]
MIRTLRILAANPLSLLGLILVCLITLAAIFAPWIAPFPTHNGAVVDFLNNNRA